MVNTLQSLKKEEGYRLSQFAVFYRTNAQSRIFEDELRRQNIPYVIYGGVRFYDRMEIKDILAYLWVLANPLDTLHLKRIINTPARGIGKVTVEKLEDYATRRGVPLFEALSQVAEAGITSGTGKKILQFVELMKTMQGYRVGQGLSQFVRTLMEKSGYIEELKAEGTLEAEGRMENLEELVSVVAEYEGSTQNPSLAEFLDQVSLVSDLDRWEEGTDVLPLMTLHLAKGLEFDHVFFVGMEEGLLPHVRSFDTPEEMDEERRLTYVGMTRAKRRLFLTNATRRKVFGNDQYNLPSRFLDDIPGELIERVEIQGIGRWEKGQSDSDWDGIPNFPSQPKPREDPTNPYKIGAKVRHPIFGVGTIRLCEGDADNRKITVAFSEAGQKKLLAKFSNLTILG